MKKILIITCKEDFHPTSVLNLMEEQHIPFFRLNTEALMTDYEFCWICNNNKSSLYIKDKLSGKDISEEEIWSVWYRRPKEPIDSLFHVNDEIDNHNWIEAKTFYTYLMYYLSDVYSIGNHRHDKYANSKMVQQRMAAKLGMKIPNSCISNTKRDVADFCSNFKDIVLKPLHSYGIWLNPEKVYTLFTTKIPSSSIMNLPEDAFTQTVSFCEDYVEKIYEVRVTVMGSHIFSCKLDSQVQGDDTGKIDWRQGYDYNLKHEVIEIPKDVDAFCRTFLRQLNLHFGCFDFIVTPEDEYVFLECNPNGQWGWIEDELELPMSEALLDCLVHRLEV